MFNVKWLIYQLPSNSFSRERAGLELEVVLHCINRLKKCKKAYLDKRWVQKNKCKDNEEGKRKENQQEPLREGHILHFNNFAAVGRFVKKGHPHRDFDIKGLQSPVSFLTELGVTNWHKQFILWYAPKQNPSFLELKSAGES